MTVAVGEMEAAFATLVRLREAAAALDDSQSQARDEAERRAKGLAIVASDADRLKKALAATLQSETAVGRSAYDTRASFLSLVQAVFWALGAENQSVETEKLRASTFVVVLQLLHSSNAASLAQPVVNELLQELHSLQIEDLASSVSEVIRGVTHAQRSQHRGDALAVYYTVELLPQLLLRVSGSMSRCFSMSQSESELGDVSGPDFRKSVLEKLSGLPWPRRFFLQVLKSFRDFSFTQDEERIFCIKIYREARKEFNSASDRARALEIFPTVCLNLLQLVGRTQNVLCSRLLTRLLISKCQHLSVVASTDINGAPGIDTDTSSKLSERDVQAIQSTVLYHVDMAMRQWEKLGKAMMVEYEQRSPEQLNTFDIALLLLIASHPKYEAQANSYLVRYVVQTYNTYEFGSSNGHEEAIRRKTFITVIQSAQDGSWTPVIHQMISLGLKLIECRGLKNDLPQSPDHTISNAASPTSWTDFGVRLLLACFQYHEAAREKILDRIVNMIVVQNADCRTYVYVISRIVSRHVAELNGQLDARIRECLEYVTHMEPDHAHELLVALSPLLKTQHTLKNFVILILRKAMFRKDEGSRIIAIQGFSLLLCLSTKIFSRTRTLSQLYSQNVTALSQSVALSSSVHHTAGIEADLASQEHAHALAAEELFRQFCGIFRRALQLQSRVRLVLYAELVKVFCECPALQESILKLLFQHYLKYYESNESIQPPLKLDLSLSRKRGVYEEPLQYLLHAMLYCLAEIKSGFILDDQETMMDEIISTQAVVGDHISEEVEKNVIVLFERLRRCELTDFDFDKTSTFSPSSELGETNQRLASLVMGIIEVAINWSVSQSPPRRETGEIIAPSIWQDLLRYAQIYLWVERKLVEPEFSVGDAKGTKKRKLNKFPVKTEVVHGGGRRATDSIVLEQRSAIMSFERSASLKWATLISPDSLLRMLEAGRQKMASGSDAVPLAEDDEELILLIVTKSVDFLHVIQRMRGERTVSKRPTFRQSHETKRFDEDRFTRQLCSVFTDVLQRYCGEDVALAKSTGNPSKKRSLQDSGLSQQRMRKVVEICVVGFALIVEMWSRLPPEELEDRLVRSLCFPSSESGSPDYDVEGDESDGLSRVLPPLQRLVEALLSYEMPENANRILDVVQYVWAKISDRSSATAVASLKPQVEWVKTLLLTRSNQASPRILDKLITLLLRPHRGTKFRSDFAQQLAHALRRFCNNEGEDCDNAPLDTSTSQIDFTHLSEKHMLSVANGLLGKVENALLETERAVKTYDIEQRRHSLKFKEDDLSALHQLEDETGSQIFASDKPNNHAGGSAMFKTLCKELFDLGGAVRPFVAMSLSSPVASNRIIRLVGRLFKLLVVVVRDKVRRKDATVPRFLRQLFDRMAGDLSPALLQFIQCVHEESNRAGQSKKRPMKTGKNMTVIPEVVFQLEQFDLVMVKLSKLCRGHDFSSWCKLRPSRDFRLNKEKVQRTLNEAVLKKTREGEQPPSGVISNSDGERTTDDATLEDTVEDNGVQSANGATESDEEPHLLAEERHRGGDEGDGEGQGIDDCDTEEVEDDSGERDEDE